MSAFAERKEKIHERIDEESFSFIEDLHVKTVVLQLLHYSHVLTLTKEEKLNLDLSNYDMKGLDLLEKQMEEQYNESDKLLQSVVPLILREASKAEVEKVVKVLSPVSNFLKRTEVLLSIGGDDRLTIHPEKKKLNKYFSSTYPRPDMIRRGSCTCSTVSNECFRQLDTLCTAFQTNVVRQSLSGLNQDNSAISTFFDGLCQDLIDRIKKTMGVERVDGSKLVLFPSGSDAEYLPLVLAFIRSHSQAVARGRGVEAVKVFNFVTAAGEVGSGTPGAAGGRHFSAVAPRGHAQGNGDLLEGVRGSWVEVLQYLPRDDEGKTQFREQEIADHVRRCLSEEGSVAVLHLVCGSKTGLVYPSLATVDALRGEFGQRLVVVADACQLRCHLSTARDYTLTRDCVTLITGSKFFTGPPFAGGVLLSAAQAQEIEGHLGSGGDCVVPAGLRTYLTPYDVDQGMPQLRKFLQPPTHVETGSAEDRPWMNLGLYLRWSGGLDVMERFSALDPLRVSQFTRWWVGRVRALVERHAPFLQLVEDEDAGIRGEMAGDVNSIVSFAVFVPVREPLLEPTGDSPMELRFLDQPESKKLHQLITFTPQEIEEYVGDKFEHDITALFSSHVAVRAMIGQPVKLAKNGFTIVRLALGADIVVDALQSEEGGMAVFAETDCGIPEFMGQNKEVGKIIQEDELVVVKLANLARYWNQLHREEEVSEEKKRIAFL